MGPLAQVDRARVSGTRCGGSSPSWPVYYFNMNKNLTGYPRICNDIDLTDSIILSNDFSHYLKNVLRLKNQDKFVILGKENIGLYQIVSVNKKTIESKRIFHRKKKSANYRINVFQSVLKREYMDFTIEKLSELGATSITPVITERSIRKINLKTLERYKKLAIKGMLQSENEYLTEINEPLSIDEINPEKKFYIFYERKDKKELPEINENNITIFIGPEGGISEKELEILKGKGGQVISPIDSILKAETAAIVFTGLVKCLMEISIKK